jgi:hypothetical protein
VPGLLKGLLWGCVVTMAKVRIDLVERQVRDQLLKSAAVEAEVVRVAREVAARAGSGFVVETAQLGTRVVARVFDPSDGARWREAATGDLARAVR